MPNGPKNGVEKRKDERTLRQQHRPLPASRKAADVIEEGRRAQRVVQKVDELGLGGGEGVGGEHQLHHDAPVGVVVVVLELRRGQQR